METELDRREARLAAARRKLAELTSGPGAEPELLAEIEQAHGRVETLERKMRGAKLPGLAVRLRQQLNAAQAAERELLVSHGFDSWMGYQLRRVEQLLYQPSPEEVEAAELEHRRALASWRELAAALETEAGAGESVEAEQRPSTIAPWPTAWSALPT